MLDLLSSPHPCGGKAELRHEDLTTAPVLEQGGGTDSTLAAAVAPIDRRGDTVMKIRSARPLSAFIKPVSSYPPERRECVAFLDPEH